MANKFVVGISCTGITKQTKPKKQSVYFFEVTWSDETKTLKNISFDDILVFRKNFKTEVYNDSVIPEVPGEKNSRWLESKTKKDEKKRKCMEEFFQQIVNLPHVTGKLQAIATMFSPTIKNISNDDHNSPMTDDNLSVNTNNLNDLQTTHTEAGLENDEEKEEPILKNDEKEVENKDRKDTRKKITYVEVEFLNNGHKGHKKKKIREAEEHVLYAEVVPMTSYKSIKLPEIEASTTEFLSTETSSVVQTENESTTASYENIFEIRTQLKNAESKTREVEEVGTKSVVMEIPVAMENTKKKFFHMKSEKETVDKTAMTLDTTADDTLILALPVPCMPTFSCPSFEVSKVSAIKELSKTQSLEEEEDDPMVVHVVAIADYDNSVTENAMYFTKGQRAVLIHASQTSWWCIRSANDVCGWVPSDYWVIQTDDKKICSKKDKSPWSPWSIGVLDRTEAERLLLKKGKDREFLVRESANSTGHLVLSMKYTDQIRHFGIDTTESGTYYIGRHYFKTLHNVIIYYKKNAILYDENNSSPVFLGRFFSKSKGVKKA